MEYGSFARNVRGVLRTEEVYFVWLIVVGLGVLGTVLSYLLLEMVCRNLRPLRTLTLFCSVKRKSPQCRLYAVGGSLN